MYPLEKEFYNLVNILKNNQYDPKIDSHRGYIAAGNILSNDNIKFGFCTLSIDEKVFWEVNGRFSAYVGDYKKWKNCIITLSIPINNKQITFLLEALFFLSNKSESFCIDNKQLWVRDYHEKSFYDLK